MDVGTISFIAFVAAMALIIYLKRDKIEFQWIIAIYRTKQLRSAIYSVGERFQRFWKAYFNIGIVVCFIMMILGTAYIIVLTAEVLSGTGPPAFGLVIPYPTSEISYNSGFLLVPSWLWVIAIPFLLIPHELSHGLALAANKLRIKSLGLLALLIIPGAFVEPDEKQLKKAGKLQKLQVYCAGSFSNIITGVIFIGIIYLILAAFYTPAGVYYTFPTDSINRSAIISNMTLPNGMIELSTSNSTYLATTGILNMQANKTEIIVLGDLPAARNNISGPLRKIGNISTNTDEDVQLALSKYKPGDSVQVETSKGNYSLILVGENSTARLGILLSQPNLLISVFAPQNARPYEPKYAPLADIGAVTFFVMTFIIAVCLGVALFNMLPMKPLDGGLAIEAVTNSKITNPLSVFILIILLINLGAAFF